MVVLSMTGRKLKESLNRSKQIRFVVKDRFGMGNFGAEPGRRLADPAGSGAARRR